MSKILNSRIFLLHGNNSFFRKKKKRAIIQSWMKDKASRLVTSFYLEAESQKEKEERGRIGQKINVTPFFVEKELLIITLGPKKSLELEKFVAGLLNRLPSPIDLIIEAEYHLLVSSSLLKEALKQSGCQVIDFKLPPRKNRLAFDAEVRTWIKEQELNLDWPVVNQLINSSQHNFWFVFTALEQAAALQKRFPGKNISSRAVELWNLDEDKSIFWLFDAIGRGEKAKALDLLYSINSRNIFRSGEDVKSVLGFSTLMARQLRQMIAVKEGISQKIAQTEWQVPPFAFNKLRYQAACFSLDFLGEAFLRLVKLQQNAKRGLASPLWLLNFFVLYLISHRETRSVLS